MALRNQPYLPLYVQDFLTDEKLIECTALATGVYAKTMCVMHKSEVYGTILLKQKDKQKDKQVENFALKLAKFLPWSLEVIIEGLEELLFEGVLFIEGDFLKQKRMIKDGNISDKRAVAGSKGGKKTLGKDVDFAQAKYQANSEYENEGENEIKDDSNLVFKNTLLKNEKWKKTVSEHFKISVTEVELKLDQFYNHLTTDFKNHTSMNEFAKHFKSWVPVHKLKNEKSNENTGGNKPKFVTNRPSS